MIIKSADNKNFKLFKSLLTKKGSKDSGLCLISGKKLLPEFINHKYAQQIIATESNRHKVTSDLPTFLFQKNLFNVLDDSGTDHPLLVFKTPDVPTTDLSIEPGGLQVLTPMGQPNNLGALIRSALAFETDKVVLLKEACYPFLPKVIKASSGSVLKTKLFYGPSIKELQKIPFYSLDKNGKDITKFQWPKNLNLLIGEEGPGFPECAQPVDQINIPMNSKIESLNASHATSIALFSYFCFQRN